MESARSVSEARTALARATVDAAVVDSQAPGMAGMDFLQELRREWPALPILLASAFWKEVQGREQLLKELRVARILQKPYTPQELVIWVEQVLARPKQDAPPVMVPVPTDLAAELAAVNAEYGRHLRRRLASLRETVAQARAGSREAIEAVSYDAQKLHGSAGSFGYVSVGEAAGQLAALVKPAREGGTVDWADVDIALHVLAETNRPARRAFGRWPGRAAAAHEPAGHGAGGGR